MENVVLEQSILEIANLPVGQLGVCAETIDASHRVEINADELYPAASSIKMYVLFTLLAKADDGQLALTDRLEFNEDFVCPGSGVLSHLDRGLKLTLKDLATLMMMISDNSALMLLVDYLSIEAINTEIEALGLKSTRFGDWGNFETTYSDSMLFGQATPCEFVQFLSRMRNSELLTERSRSIFWDTLRIQKYIEPMRKFLPASPWSREFGIPEPVWVASKSGLLDDCATESGFVRVHEGGWVVSIMIKNLPEIAMNPSIGESLISAISLKLYEAWSPFYTKE